MEIIENNPDKPWNWKDISSHDNMTMEIIEKYPDKPWSWCGISENPNITMEIIENNFDNFWNFEYISENPNLTIEFIEKYPYEYWNWDKISINEFKKDYEKELQKLKFKQIEEELIQKTWHPKRFQDWCLNEDEKVQEDEEKYE